MEEKALKGSAMCGAGVARVFRTLTPALLSPPEAVEACMLNGTIIAVSCCLLLRGQLVGQQWGCCGKGRPYSNMEMRETGRPTPNALSLPPGFLSILEPGL